jgi:hypothetical protein
MYTAGRGTAATRYHRAGAWRPGRIPEKASNSLICTKMIHAKLVNPGKV